MRRPKKILPYLFFGLTLLSHGTAFSASDDEIDSVELYGTLANKHSDQYEFYYELGGSYYKLKIWNSAINAFKTSLSIQPNNPDAKLSLAYALLFQNTSPDDLDESKRLFEEILAVDPGYIDAQEGLNKIDQIKRLKPEQIIEEEIEEKNPPPKPPNQCDKDLLKIAQNLADKNNLLVAIIIYQKLLKEHPDQPDYYNQLARSYFKMQSFNFAMDAYKKALELEPTNQDTMVSLGYVGLAQYSSQDDLYSARNLFLQVLQAVPDYADAQIGLAKVDQLLGIHSVSPGGSEPEQIPRPVPVEKPVVEPTATDDDVAGILLYGFITKNKPEQPHYYYELGRSYSKVKAWNEAINAFQEALNQQPDNADAKLGLAYAYLFRYLNKTILFDSKQLFEQVLAVNSKYTDAVEGLKKVDDLIKGVPFVPAKKTAAKGETCATPILEIAEQLDNENNGWAAIMFYNELIAADPNNASYYYHLGQSYVKVKSWERAIDAFNKSLELQPENADARVAVAYAYLFRYLSRCDLSESGILFDEVLKAFPNYSDAAEGLRRVQSILHQLSHPVNLGQEESPEEAEEKKKLEAKRAWENSLSNIAKKLTLNHDFDGALLVYKILTEVFPKNAEYFFLQGQQFAALEEHCLAIESFQRAIEIKPDYSDALIALGTQYSYFDLPAFAFEYYKRAVASTPDSIDALVGLARTEALLDNISDAERHYLEALALAPNNPDAMKPYGSFLLGQRRYIESEDVYRSLVALQNDFQSYRSTLFDIASHTSPTFYIRAGKGVEREKDLFSKLWSASLTYSSVEPGIIYPIHDKLRMILRGRWGDLKQKNLIAKNTLFDCKFAGAGLGAEYFYNPYWSLLTGINFLWITNDNNHAQLHTQRSAKYEPSLLFRYVKDKDSITFGEVTDTNVFKNFDKNRVTAFTRETALLVYQRDFNNQLYAGADVAWIWYQDPIHNQEQDINAWAQAGIPYFEENLSCRYHSEYRQFKKETTGYYSFEYQWTHWLKFRWLKTWDFGGHCELLYWHGWRTVRGKNPQQQITTTALAAIAPVVTINDQINAIYLTLGYSPDENCDISASGSYWNDSYDYTVWGGKVSLEWRF